MALPFSRTFGTRWGGGQPDDPAASTPGKDPVPIVQDAGWAPGPVWTGGKSRTHRDSIPDRPARSQSLYRLSYPVHPYVFLYMCKIDVFYYIQTRCSSPHPIPRRICMNVCAFPNTTGRYKYWIFENLNIFFRESPQLSHNLIETHRHGSWLCKKSIINCCISILAACLYSIFRIAKLFGLIWPIELLV